MYIHNGYCYRDNGKSNHVAVWEEHNKREKGWNCHIHHINHNKLDDRIENLIELTDCEHFALHQIEDKHPELLDKMFMMYMIRLQENDVNLRIATEMDVQMGNIPLSAIV